MDNAIEISGLWQGYRAGATRRRLLGFRYERETNWALRGIDLRVRCGEVAGVIGSTGAGKSTLLASIAGVLPPSRGVVSVTGRVAPMLVPHPGLHRDLTGCEHLLVAGGLLGLRRRQVRALTDAIAERAGLDRDVLDHPLRTYSAGMVARLEFALAMSVEAAVLVLDEHLAAIDEAFRRRLAEGLHEFASRGGTAVIASHELDFVAGVCHRLVLLEDGEVLRDGTPDVVLGEYRGLRVVPPPTTHPEPDRAPATEPRPAVHPGA